MDNKTKFGKFISVILVISCILFVIGLGLMFFEVIVNVKNLDVDAYQSIIDLGNVCMKYAGSFSITVVTPGIIFMSDNKNLNKKSIKNKVPFFKSVIVILGVIYIINLMYDIGFVVGEFIAR